MRVCFSLCTESELSVYACLSERGSDKIPEQGMGPVRARAEFRMELHAYEPGMILQLDDLDKVAFRISAGEAHRRILKLRAI